MMHLPFCGALKQDILDALDWMCRNKYNGDWYSDWWDWQIGSPIALEDSIILMYDALSAKQLTAYLKSVAHYMGDPATDHGANRSWRCKVYALYGILAKEPAPLEHAAQCFGSLFEYVTEDEGFYEDGSFIQHHDHPYTLGYGINLLTDMADLRRGTAIPPRIPETI